MFKKLIIILFTHIFFCNGVSANIDIKARTAILQDFLSGEILYEKEPDRSIYPASMTKIMTSIIAFELIKFAIMMTSKAKEIGMENTNFANSSGINDPDNYSTVRDIMIMTHYLISEFPEFYKWIKEKEFTWDRTGGDPITQGNRNPLLYKNMGADGVKTGYLAVERYSLSSSIERKGRRLIAVGSGFETKNSRSKESSKLLTYGLTNFDLIEISKENSPFDSLDVWLGKENSIKVYTKENIYKIIKKGQKKLLKAKVVYEGPIEAPIKKDQKLAKLKIIYDQDLIGEYDLLAIKDIKKVNIFSRLIKSLNYLIWGDV